MNNYNIVIIDDKPLNKKEYYKKTIYATVTQLANKKDHELDLHLLKEIIISNDYVNEVKKQAKLYNIENFEATNTDSARGIGIVLKINNKDKDHIIILDSLILNCIDLENDNDDKKFYYDYIIHHELSHVHDYTSLSDFYDFNINTLKIHNAICIKFWKEYIASYLSSLSFPVSNIKIILDSNNENFIKLLEDLNKNNYNNIYESKYLKEFITYYSYCMGILHGTGNLTLNPLSVLREIFESPDISKCITCLNVVIEKLVKKYPKINSINDTEFIMLDMFLNELLDSIFTYINDNKKQIL